eukprot:TRINITY_DN4462_c0_g1_i7.p1 TRINITY_DN4462_c0_g1~~TRINITY_DN4462_c0_g1_i7.p1  ORF type:complete len:253 (-),score=46.86 TRINITY_DN4462_c0_g1_i7:271-1029(-)
MLIIARSTPSFCRAAPAVLSIGVPVRTVKTRQAPASAFSPHTASLQVPVKTLEGEQVSTLDLSPDVFGLPIRRDLVHRVVVWQRACRRQGSASSKSRGQVRGSTAKLYRQKGTGKARVGSARAPHRVGGGVAHGPKPRDFSYTLPKQVRRLGLCTALSAKLFEGRLSILQDLSLESHKTKPLSQLLQGAGLTNALFVDADLDDGNFNFMIASRNIPNIKVAPSRSINVYAMLKREQLVLTESAVAMIQSKLA